MIVKPLHGLCTRPVTARTAIFETNILEHVGNGDGRRLGRAVARTARRRRVLVGSLPIRLFTTGPIDVYTVYIESAAERLAWSSYVQNVMMTTSTLGGAKQKFATLASVISGTASSRS